MKPYRFIISGGGTGGHIYPAVAIANELKERFPDAEFLFVGARDRMEMEKVPKAGFDIEGLWISGIQRKLSLKNLMFPLKLISSLMKSKKILRKFKPNIAVGTGGYASAPLLRAAAGKGIPCLIQEQNSHAGITNRWLADKVNKICVAYNGMDRFFPSEKIVLTGNPVRSDLLEVTANRQAAYGHFKLDPNKKTLLVLGGSLGSKRINELIDQSVDFFSELALQQIWQCGSFYYDKYAAKENDHVKVLAFINRMDLAYAAADFIISRSGALSVSELCLVGKPVIFIPSPNVAEDHQTKNAEAIVSKEAAMLLKESELDSEFESRFRELVADDDRQRRYSENIKNLARPEATKDIVKEILKLMKA